MGVHGAGHRVRPVGGACPKCGNEKVWTIPGDKNGNPVSTTEILWCHYCNVRFDDPEYGDGNHFRDEVDI